MDTRPRVIVKVGKTSSLAFRNIKALRAITFDEVQRLVSNNPSIPAVIIESIMPYEVQPALNMVDWLNNQGKQVFIHCIAGANSQELKISEDKGISISSTLEELQHSISSALAVKATTAWGKQTDSAEVQVEAEAESVTEKIIPEDTSVKEIMQSEPSDLHEALKALNDTKKTTEVVHQSISTKDDLLESLGLDFRYETEEASPESAEIFEEIKDQSMIELNSLLDAVTKEKAELSNQLEVAFDKIHALLDIKEAVEDERDLLRTTLSGLESSTEIIEDPIPGARLEEAKSQINSLQQRTLNLESSVYEYKSESKALAEQINTLTSDLSAVKEQEELLKQQLIDKQAKIDSLNEGLAAGESVKIDLANTRAEKQALEKTAVNLRDKIKDLTNEIDTAMSRSSTDDLEKIRSLRLEIDSLTDTIAEGDEKVAIESRGRLVIGLLLAEAIKQKSTAHDALLSKNGEVAELAALEKKLRSSLRSSQEELRLVREKFEELTSELSTEKEKSDIRIEELQEKYTHKLGELKVQLDTRILEAKRASKELTETKTALNKKETELAALMTSTGASKKSIDSAVKAKQALEEANTTLNSTVEVLKKDIRTLTSKLSMTEDANTKLEEANKQLRTNMVTMKATSSAAPSTPGKPQAAAGIPMGRIRLDCDYSGRGYIIPVFGSGSYGITTMAISIARKLPKASILYMDMDIVNPKSDAWFGKMPLIRELTDIADPLKKSGFGALLEKGSSYVIDNKRAILQRITDTKAGSTIDYFSGAYTKVDARKLLAINFSELLSHLGNMYNYIVVDLGRFGSSDIGDELVKMFNKIAFKSVIMSLNDKFDTRTMSVRINTERIKLDNAIWVLNMSDSSKVDNIVQKSIGIAKPVIMPKDMNIYGQGESFDKVPILKDKLAQVMDLLLAE